MKIIISTNDETGLSKSNQLIHITSNDIRIENGQLDIDAGNQMHLVIFFTNDEMKKLKEQLK